MLFNSLQFLLFFTAVTLTYYSLPKGNGRWSLLLIASCYFYAVFQPTYIFILFLTIVIDYIAGIWLEKTPIGPKRKWLLIISLISNLGILAFFKYLGFFTENIASVLRHLYQPELAVQVTSLANRVFLKVISVFGQSGVTSYKDKLNILPIGLSFHTFQAMSYTIEVYRGNQKAERHFGIYALYVMFYPQLVAGPIERPQNVLHQFHTHFAYDFENIKAGLMRMAFGFFKKCVIGDRLAMMVDPAYADPANHNGLTLLMATFLYTFQIYCDFSAYSDIAIGAARVMGFNLMENFRAPYMAWSITEFWRRWHISLSTWFRDYLYIPLGGNRKGETRRNVNQMLVFLASGLWHGANWTYVIWGGLHGLYQVAAGLRDKWLTGRKEEGRNGGTTRSGGTEHVMPQQAGFMLPKRLWHVGNVLITFGLVMLTWVFFRATSVRSALLILKKIGTLSPLDALKTPLNATELWFSLLLIGFLLVKESRYLVIPTRSTPLFFAIITLICFATYIFGVFTSNQFIYFQF
ncbi:MBOAT family O-acyltransferase [Fibrella aquatilis]|uniref:MBOAT family protein n=1 Tax=Fibrella aquatilis TaxID=2817059 RepID=A0A939G501_9BACT|nr:MBOAT family O-acyltransferase [Fibrella aquatilis]MBO0930734.1 MBOAT family protein [Fibrella aquatilis]